MINPEYDRRCLQVAAHSELTLLIFVSKPFATSKLWVTFINTQHTNLRFIFVSVIYLFIFFLLSRDQRWHFINQRQISWKFFYFIIYIEISMNDDLYKNMYVDKCVANFYYFQDKCKYLSMRNLFIFFISIDICW